MNKTETVEVTRILNSQAEITFIRTAMCACCNFSGLCGKASQRLLIDCQGFSLKKGDRIEILIEEKKTILAAILMFLLPAFIFVLALAGLQANYGNMKSFLLAVAAICIYYVLLKFLLKKAGTSFNIKIVRKVEEANL